MGSPANLYQSPWAWIISYGLGVLASWGTLSAIQDSIYVPVLTVDLLIMLGIGIIYFM